MSAVIRAVAALLDAFYREENSDKADVWREMAVLARREYDDLRAELAQIRAVLEVWERDEQPPPQSDAQKAAEQIQAGLRYSDEIEAKLKVIRDLYNIVHRTPMGQMFHHAYVREYLEPVGMPEILRRHHETYYTRHELLDLLQRLWRAVLPNAVGSDRYVGGMVL